MQHSQPLFLPFLRKNLTVAYKNQKKPDNWQSDKRAIKNEDKIEEIMERNFGDQLITLYKKIKHKLI